MLIRQFFAQKKCVLSLEVFPPKTEPGWKKLQHLLREAKKMDPSFISITCSAGGSGTAGIPTSQVAAFVKNEVQIEPLTHITCVGSSEADLNDNLQHLMASGIRNIMCLRGDINPELPLHKDFLHASDLAAYIQKHYGCFRPLWRLLSPASSGSGQPAGGRAEPEDQRGSRRHPPGLPAFL